MYMYLFVHVHVYVCLWTTLYCMYFGPVHTLYMCICYKRFECKEIYTAKQTKDMCGEKTSRLW